MDNFNTRIWFAVTSFHLDIQSKFKEIGRRLCGVTKVRQYLLPGKDELELRVDFVVEELAVDLRKQNMPKPIPLGMFKGGMW